ncbi:MAG: heavy metal-associated domain-containing protein [Barnesiella sp.]|nr:heavy metal-associated domain-containing protein [Barnesiella sp.]
MLQSLLSMLNSMSPYILLGFLIAGIIYVFVPRAAMARHLSGKGWKPAMKAALLGVPLPLCSCGVLPTAISMRRNGASRGASTSFLIATPQTGVDSIAATWSLLGPAFAVVRPIAALVTAVAGGTIVSRHDNEETGADARSLNVEEADDIPTGFAGKVGAALRYGFVSLVGSIGGWLVAGLVIAAVITVYVPDDFFTVLGRTPILSMLVALVVAVPMYVCATGSIPIALALVLKGLSPGTAFVLLMAGPAVNFASYTLVSREMGRRAATMYLGSIIVGAVGFGLVIDYLLPSQWFEVTQMHAACHHGESLPLFPTICSAILSALLIYSLVITKIFRKHSTISTMAKEYKITGMNCPHCQAAVTKSIQGVEGVTSVEVDLKGGKATVDGDHDSNAVIEAVRMAGFDAENM